LTLKRRRSIQAMIEAQNLRSQSSAEELKEIAEIVALEAIRMAAAEKRFSGRRGPRSERRARE
jgi:hypothetical protein